MTAAAGGRANAAATLAVHDGFRLRRFIGIKRLVPRSNSATGSAARPVNLRRSG